MKIVDAHCHLHEYTDEKVEFYASKYVLVAVSDDLESSLRTVELAERYGVYCCVGVHPWEVEEEPRESLREIEALVSKGLATCIGEVGLDKKFVPHSFERQLEFFEFFVRLAVEYTLPMNIHGAGAWREVFEALHRVDVEKAVFHWYTGPLDLLDEIIGAGYFITVNPSIRFQKKHREVVARTPLTSILTESDGPYEYRGLSLSPDMITSTLKVVASLKGVSIGEVAGQVYSNLARFLGSRFRG